MLLLRDRATNRYLVSGAEWSLDERRALAVDADEAAAIVARFACEPDAIELVDAAEPAVA